MITASLFATFAMACQPTPWSRVKTPPPAPELAAHRIDRGLPDRGQGRGSGALVDLDIDGHLDLITSVRRLDRGKPGEGLFVFLGDGCDDVARVGEDGIRVYSIAPAADDGR